MQSFPTSLPSMLTGLWNNRRLLAVLVKRDVGARYRGSVMGLAWSFFTPLLMLVIYTFVFSVIFKTRWGLGQPESRTDFAILLFVGMIMHSLFAECINAAPGLIVFNANYVKKIVFPLEILPWVTFCSALFNATTSIIVLLMALVLLGNDLHWTIVLLPAVLLPLALGTMGLTWLLASLGVFLRDVGQLTGILTTIMLFMSGVFFPISALSERLQFWLRFNPLAVIIEQSRQVLVFGQVPDVLPWLVLLVVGLGMAWAGYACFQKTRKGFADVL